MKSSTKSVEVNSVSVTPDTLLTIVVAHGKRKTKRLITLDVMVTMMGGQPIVQVSVIPEDVKAVRGNPIAIVERVSVAPRKK